MSISRLLRCAVCGFGVLLLAADLADAGDRRWFRVPGFGAKDQMAVDYPVGSRQKFKHGKYWPPFPRPTGKQAPYAHQYHAARYWPYPYDCEDESAVRNVLRRQRNNGWINATTLYAYHFDGATHGLNRAGELHLQWILRNAPASHRLTFVQASADDQTSQARAESVREFAAQLVGENHVPAVMLRIASPNGRPARMVDRMLRSERTFMAQPTVGTNKIGNVTVGGGTAGGGGGGAAGGGGGAQ